MTPTKVARISEVNIEQSSQESKAVKSTPTKSNVTKAKTTKSTPLKIAQTNIDKPSNIDQSSMASSSSSTQESKENKGRRLNRNICSIKESWPLAITNNQVKQLPGDAVSIPSDSDDSALDAEEQEFKLKQQAAAEAKIKQEQALSKKSKSVGRVKSEKQKQKEASRNEWFDPAKFDTSWIKHPSLVKKELPPGAEIYCSKCNEVFGSIEELTKHEKKCYTGRRYPCTWQGCKHINLQKSLLHQHIKAIHYNDLFRFQVCNEPFIYKKLLQKHAKKVHDTGLQKFKYNCPKGRMTGLSSLYTWTGM